MDPSSIITQVSQGKASPDLSTVITQVKPTDTPGEEQVAAPTNNESNHNISEEKHITEEAEDTNTKERGGFFRCFGASLCCRSKSKSPEPVLLESNKDNNKQIKKETGPSLKKSSLFHSYFCCLRGIKKSKPKQPPNDGGSLMEAPAYLGDEKQLLGELRPEDVNKKCLVIDLDETLVHSSFKPISNADFIVPVEIDGTIHQVYVLKRPHVDEFLKHMGDLYECVLFTASLAKYADPVTDLLDKWGVFRARLFREACVFHRGNYVKDLRRLGREVSQVIIIDNSPASYVFHPDNAVPVASWFDDMADRELLDLIPFLENLNKVDNVYTALQSMHKTTGQQGPGHLT